MRGGKLTAAERAEIYKQLDHAAHDALLGLRARLNGSSVHTTGRLDNSLSVDVIARSRRLLAYGREVAQGNNPESTIYKPGYLDGLQGEREGT